MQRRIRVSTWIIDLYSVIGVIALLSVLPLFISSYYTRLVAVGILYGIAATGFNILFGYTGLLSFGHAMFWGLGGYIIAIGLIKLGLSFPLSVLLSLTILVLVALGAGYISLRHTEIYFAMLTLALSQLAYAIMLKWRSLTGGDEGLYGIPRPLGTITHYYYLILLVSLITLIVVWLVLRSPIGLAFQTIRDNPGRAETIGYNVRRLRLLSFLISGIVTGIAGIMYVPLEGAITPEALYWTFSAEIVFMALLGGTRAFLGPFIGGIVYVFIRDYAMDITEYWLFVMGVILALLVYILPDGVVGTIYARIARLQRLKR